MGGGRDYETGQSIYIRRNGVYYRRDGKKIKRNKTPNKTIENLSLSETRRSQEDSYESINYDIVGDGKTIGYATIINDENEAYLERIDIDEEYRNQGLGTKAILDLSEKYGGLIVAPDNEDARRLYERLGYETSNDMYDQGFGVYEI